MTDLLLATVAVVLLVALALAVLAALTLVPFLVTLQLAERRRFSLFRWGAVSLAGSVFGLVVALLVLRGGSSPGVAAAVLLPILAAPLLLVLLPPEDPLGGRAGRHS